MAESVQHPLFDIELEQRLIGCFLVDARTVAIARPLVNADDFEDELHQLIVALVYDFEEDGKSFSPATLNSWIKHNPAVKNADRLYGEELPPGHEGGAYLAYLAQAAPALPHLADTAGMAMAIADFALRRRAVWAMGEAQDAITAREKSVPGPILEALAPIVQIADEIAEKQTGIGISTNAMDRGHETLRQIEEQAATGEEFGVQTKLAPLDALIGGLYPENLCVVAGRPSMGKSILACYLLLSAARQGYAADYWSIEMPSREVMARILCDIDYDLAIEENLAPIEYRDIVRMQMTNTMFERAAMANQKLHGLDINIFDRNRVRMGDVVSASRARAARAPEKRRLIVIDHLHILMADERYRGNRVQELSEMTGAAKRLSKQIQGTVVLLSQLSRDIERREDKRPLLSDLRDSGSIEQDADVVLSLYRHQYYAQAAIRAAKNTEQRDRAIQEYDESKSVLEIGVLKQRSGETNIAKVYVDVKSSVVRSHDPREDLTAAQAAMHLAEGR